MREFPMPPFSKHSCEFHWWMSPLQAADRVHLPPLHFHERFQFVAVLEANSWWANFFSVIYDFQEALAETAAEILNSSLLRVTLFQVKARLSRAHAAVSAASRFGKRYTSSPTPVASVCRHTESQSPRSSQNSRSHDNSRFPLSGSPQQSTRSPYTTSSGRGLSTP